MLPSKLYKTTIVIWTEYDPSDMDIEYLARDATSGDSFCDQQTHEVITDKNKFPDTEFFGVDDTEDNDDEDYDYNEDDCPGFTVNVDGNCTVCGMKHEV
jgi:hypothetical protein